MLRVIIGEELFDEETQTFSRSEEAVIDLEHSLVSMSKWEAVYEKPFLADGEKTAEQIFDYLGFMIVTPNVGPDILRRCTNEDLQRIQAYIDSAQSATTFGEMPRRTGRAEVITSELIYYWLIAFQIPWECQYWHLNRLFSLIRICHVKNAKPEKMSRHEVAMRNREINARRRAELGTSG